jgi:hypothetical protein
LGFRERLFSRKSPGAVKKCLFIGPILLQFFRMDEADGVFLLRLRRFEQRANVVEQYPDFVVMLGHLAGQLLVGGQHPPEPDERPDDGQADLRGLFTAQYSRKHRHAMLGERPGRITTASPT